MKSWIEEFLENNCKLIKEYIILRKKLHVLVNNMIQNKNLKNIYKF